jgi:hypothetical protein
VKNVMDGLKRKSKICVQVEGAADAQTRRKQVKINNNNNTSNQLASSLWVSILDRQRQFTFDRFNMRIRVSASVIIALFPVVAGFSSESSSRRGDNYATTRSSQSSAEFLPGQGEHKNSYLKPLTFARFRSSNPCVLEMLFNIGRENESKETTTKGARGSTGGFGIATIYLGTKEGETTTTYRAAATR